MSSQLPMNVVHEQQSQLQYAPIHQPINYSTNLQSDNQSQPIPIVPLKIHMEDSNIDYTDIENNNTENNNNNSHKKTVGWVDTQSPTQLQLQIDKLKYQIIELSMDIENIQTTISINIQRRKSI
jgi:hypothetical protein